MMDASDFDTVSELGGNDSEWPEPSDDLLMTVFGVYQIWVKDGSTGRMYRYTVFARSLKAAMQYANRKLKRDNKG